MQKKPGQGESHLVVTLAGQPIRGSWDEILLQMKAADREWATGSLQRLHGQPRAAGPGRNRRRHPHDRCEAFIRGSAEAGVLRIVQ